MEPSDKERVNECVEDFNIWIPARRPRRGGSLMSTKPIEQTTEVNRDTSSSHPEGTEVVTEKPNSVDSNKRKFESLKKRCDLMRTNVEACQKKTEARKERKKLKALTNAASESTEKDTEDSENDEQKWQEIKPYLTINDHLSGPVSHGSYGPKMELEVMIDNAIEEGDFEKAEMLSDHLADRKFAVKIRDAFAAKRYAEKKAEVDAMKKAKRIKKLHWTFETKQRWEMKSNM